MEYKNTSSQTTTTLSTILSATTSQKLLVKTIHSANIFSGDTTLDIRWHDTSEATDTYLAYNITIPQVSSFQVLDGTFVLEPDDYIEVKTGDAAAIDLTVSYLQITDSEG